jgi:hypothetical protein
VPFVRNDFGSCWIAIEKLDEETQGPELHQVRIHPVDPYPCDFDDGASDRRWQNRVDGDFIDLELVYFFGSDADMQVVSQGSCKWADRHSHRLCDWADMYSPEWRHLLEGGHLGYAFIDSCCLERPEISQPQPVSISKLYGALLIALDWFHLSPQGFHLLG